MKETRHSSVDEVLLQSLRTPARPDARLDFPQWERLWRTSRDHCLSPYLHRQWTDSGFIATLPPAIAERFAKARADNAERNCSLLQVLDELRTALESENIPVLISKGLPVAHTYYGDLGLRVLYDLDLLIKPQDRERAFEVAQELGYVPFFAGDRRHQLLWRPRAYAWDAEHVFDPDRPCLVELHTRPWQRRWHGFGLECQLQLWEGARTREIAGVALRVPREEKLLIHLAVHYACNVIEADARLMHLLDLCLLLRQSATALDWGLILHESARSRAQPFCFVALDLAARLGQWDYPDSVRSVLNSATPRAVADWVERRGVEDVLAMNIHRREKSLIYFLHWNMAAGVTETASVLFEAVRSPWREGHGIGRWKSLASRMVQRFDEIARASHASRGAH